MLLSRGHQLHHGFNGFRSFKAALRRRVGGVNHQRHSEFAPGKGPISLVKRPAAVLKQLAKRLIAPSVQLPGNDGCQVIFLGSAAVLLIHKMPIRLFSELGHFGVCRASPL